MNNSSWHTAMQDGDDDFVHGGAGRSKRSSKKDKASLQPEKVCVSGGGGAKF